ncbi:hypothetical protein DYB37_009539 [Aphanomyces astaci]|uniref:DDE-1 domain-containing protein n=1 Tax=Aphanomyces astaci TaxID=112090 RepID=A0A3R7AVA6_APHAT|nr:hypothetical protein DYB37_009539 [Aphanomyces astaci]
MSQHHQSATSATHRKRPTLAQKLSVARLAEATSVRNAIVTTGYAESCVRDWVRDKSMTAEFKGSKTRKKNTGACGGKTILPDSHELVTHIKDLRRQEVATTSAHMMLFLRDGNMPWIEEYMATRKSGYSSLLRLLQHFMDRHGFSRQRVCRQKKTQVDLEETRIAFGKQFHSHHPDVTMDCVFNADETGLTYDMCPNTIWAIRGGGSYVANSKTHSYRMIALLTVRGDGVKLPILFVIRGAAGGVIEYNEFDDYPPGHHFAMQEKAWMNGTVWKFYLRDALAEHIENPSVLLVDNFDSHVTKATELLVKSWGVNCIHCPRTAPHIVSHWMFPSWGRSNNTCAICGC